MSEKITEVKAVLTAEDHASSVIKSFRSEIDNLRKSLRSLVSVKLPDFSSQLSAASRAAVEATKAQVRAVTTVAIAEDRAARQRAGHDQDAARRWKRMTVDAAREARDRLSFADRMARQRTAEERAAERSRKASHNAATAELRQRATLATRQERQRLTEERNAERERQRTATTAERDAASSLRRQIAGHRYLFRMRESAERRADANRERDRRETTGRGRDAWDFGRSAMRDFTRPLGTAALAAGATGGVATKRILGAESDIDSAEINTRIYGGLDKDAARRLREQWAAPLAEALGTGTDKLLTAWVDATKLGIPAAGAQAFAELSTKTSEAWSVPFEAVTDILGTVNTLLTSKGEAFNAERLRSVANTLQHLAAKQSTTPEKLISYLQRGAGAAQVLGMSQEAGLAFGSASTSLGNQAGQSGRMFDYLASRVIELPRLTKQKGDQGKQARDLVRALGYSSAEAMDRQRRDDPDAFLPDFMDRFNRIKNPKTQDQAIRFFTGREWLGEFGRMVKGIDTYREAVKLSKEAKGLDAIGNVWELHRTKLGFVFKQFRAGWLNILGEFGTVLSPMARQAGDTFLAWSAQLRSGGLKARFQAMIGGFIEGLGFKDLPALMEGILGKPGEGAAGAIESWRAAARGFGQGLRDIVEMITGAGRLLSGGSGDPETLARWIARIGAFSAALLIASPAITVLGGITSAVMALGSAALTAWGMMKIAGMIGGGATAAAAGASTLRLVASRLVGGLVGGLGLALVAEIGSRRGELATMMLEGTKSLLSSMVQGVRDALAEWKRGGLVNGFLRFLDPNFAPDPAKPQAEPSKTETPADKGTWATFWDWLQGQQQPAAPVTKAEAPKVSTWRDPPARTARPDPLRESLLSLDPALAKRLFPDQVAPDQAPRIERQSFDSSDWRDMIQPASMRADTGGTPPVSPARVTLDTASLTRGGHVIGESFLDVIRAGLAGWRQSSERPVSMGSDAAPAVERLARTVTALGATIKLASFSEAGTKAVSSFSAAGGAATTVASPVSPGFGRGNSYRPGDMNVPSWWGGRSASGMPDPGMGAGTGPYKPLLDHIAQSEGTAGRGDYNASLGYGKFLPGGKEQNLTGKTLDEVLALGDHMRRQPGNPNSSALGRYQIVGQTLRDQMKKLGLKGSDLFDEATQDRIGANLVRQRGASASGLGNEWASLRSQKLAKAVELARGIPEGASTTPGPREATDGNGPTAGAADVAARYVGKHERRDRTELGQFLGRDPTGDANAWCASFVNASLKAVGQKGTGSDIANSFLRWGKGISAEMAEKGDVLVEHRGRGADASGGHVGIATGRRRMRNGRLELEAISGNSSDSVKAEWEDASRLAVRRATDAMAATAGISSKARQALDSVAPMGRNPANLADSVPRPAPVAPTKDDLVGTIPAMPRRPAGSGGASGLEAGSAGSNGSGGGGTVINHIHATVNGAGDHPDVIANKMQRLLTERMAYRSHDIESELL